MSPGQADSMSQDSACAKDIFGEDEALSSPPSEAMPSPSLDVASFPHILALIIEYSDPSTLSTLLRCSHSTFKAAVGPLYRNLRVTQRQLFTLIYVGWAPAKRTGPASGRLDRAFSPYLSEALRCTRTLHLLRWDPAKKLPNVLQGFLEGLRATVLYPVEDIIGLGMSIQNAILSLPASRIYIRVPEAYVLRWPLDHVTASFHGLPDHIESVTLLAPLACRHIGIPSLSVTESSFGEPVAPVRRNATVVMLPWAQVEQWDRTAAIERWVTNGSHIARAADRHPINLVGAEYCGVEGNEKSLVVGALSGTARFLSFNTFAEWFAQLEPDSVFTWAEGEELRRDDRRLVLEAMEGLGQD